MGEISFEKFIEINNVLELRPPWWHELFFPWRVCAQRILVVSDGLDYNESNDFGLTQFLLTLETARPSGIAPTIEIAHTVDNDFLASTTMKAKFAYHKNFRFVNGTGAGALMNGTTRRYDQLWLFAVNGGSGFDPGERGVIEAFMNARGGVFATGDHQTLGEHICGSLLRVKNMRDWSSIPMDGMGRIDTTNLRSPDGSWNFDSQSDPIAQSIYPHFEQVGGSFVPHPLLKYGTGSSFQTDVVDVLPDHAHESECWLGRNPNIAGSTVDINEFPPLVDETTPYLPVAVATSMSGGRISEKGPVTPRGFLAISAYDGNRTGVGRISCDATWHHFLNVNLDGTGTSLNGMQDEIPPGSGTFVPNAAFNKIKQYYRNIAEWIGPVRWCRWYIDFIDIRYRFPFIEEVPFWPPRPDWADLVEIGATVESVLDQRDGRGSAANMVKDMLVGVPTALRIIAASEPAEKKNVAAPGLLRADDFVRGILGSLVHRVFSELPDNPTQAAKLFKKTKDLHGLADKVIQSGLDQGLKHAQSHYARAAQDLAKFIEGNSKTLRLNSKK